MVQKLHDACASIARPVNSESITYEMMKVEIVPQWCNLGRRNQLANEGIVNLFVDTRSPSLSWLVFTRAQGGICCRKGCLSVRQSVTVRYCVKMAKRSVEIRAHLIASIVLGNLFHMYVYSRFSVFL